MSDGVEDGPSVSDPFVLPLLQARPAPEEAVDDARRFMGGAEWLMRQLGLGQTDGADNLARYRSGEGAMREYGDEEITRHPILLRAEDRNRTSFEGQTFMAEMRDYDKNAQLRSLKDGETYRFEDGWTERLFQSLWDLGNLATDLSTYMAFGKTGVASSGALEATRRGDQLHIRGTVRHGFPRSDIFDFHDGEPGAPAARTLERNGEAAPFRITYDRRQEVETVPQYEPDGRLMLPQSTWGPIE